MTKKTALRVLAVATISLVSAVVGIKTIFAQPYPTVELTNSLGTWSVVQGNHVTLDAHVLPDYYRTVSRVEIRLGETVLATCQNQNSCSFTINSVPSGTTVYQGVAYDTDGIIYFSNMMSLSGTNVYGNPNGDNSFQLTSTATEVEPGQTGMYIEARVSDTAAIRDLRILQDNATVVASNNCTNEPYICTVRFYPVFNSSDIGKNFVYEGHSTDVNNGEVISNRITIHVRENQNHSTSYRHNNHQTNYHNNQNTPRYNAGQNQVPGVYLDQSTIPNQVNADQTVHIRSNAWDNEGLSKLTVYAYPQNTAVYSSNPHFERVCNTTLSNLDCTLDISNFYGYEGVTFNVWAETVDQAGQRVTSNTYTLRVNGTYSYNYNNYNYNNYNYYYPPANTNPTISLSGVPSEVNVDAYPTFTASAWDNEGLRTISMYAVPNDGYTYNTDGRFSKTCTVSGTSASCSLSLPYLGGYEGRSFKVYATVTDQNWNSVTSYSYSMKVRGYVQTAPTVETTVSGNASMLREDQSITVTGKASNTSGIWGMEVRAQTSWNSEMISKRCVSSNQYVQNATCTLTIGPFYGHAGESVKVWSIAWAPNDGAGKSSDSKNITITALEKPNYDPALSVTASASSLNSNQNVTVRANATDENGIDHIDLYVNAKIVKTCSGTNVCEYTGGPFGEYTGSGITYAAKAFDKTGRSTWSGYNGIPVTSYLRFDDMRYRHFNR